MEKRYVITEAQRWELEVARRKNSEKGVERRLRALILRAEGKKSKEIGELCDYHPAHVSKLVQIYCTQGLSAIVENHCRGNHRNLRFEEEAALLQPFREQAEAGQLVEVSAIKAAYEERLGRSLSSRGQIYYVLKRHGWRKIMPRSQHPNKASQETIDVSKKLTSGWRICELSTGTKTTET